MSILNNEMNILVKYEVIIKKRAISKIALFNNKDEALMWALSTDCRTKLMGAELNLVSAWCANEEPKFWDIRKDFWNYRADKNKVA